MNYLYLFQNLLKKEENKICYNKILYKKMLDIKWIISNPGHADKLFIKRGIKPIANKLIKISQNDYFFYHF